METTTSAPATEPEVYDAWRQGEISDEEAREFFGEDWEAVKQMARAQDVLADQPEPEVAEDDLFR